MKIGIASDHRGYLLKENLVKFLEEENFIVTDLGTDDEFSVDYPDYAFKLGEAVANKDVDMGIAICASGIGISISCNKVKGVRCAKVDNIDEATITRIDNDANVIAISSLHNLDEAKKLVIAFLTTEFSKEERHERRIKKISDYEQGDYHAT